MKMKDFFSDESKWCRRHTGINKRGEPCVSSDAVACCLIGAAHKCYGDSQAGPIINRIHFYLLGSDLHEDGLVSSYNDNPKTTFSDIQNLVNALDI